MFCLNAYLFSPHCLIEAAFVGGGGELGQQVFSIVPRIRAPFSAVHFLPPQAKPLRLVHTQSPGLEGWLFPYYMYILK